MKSLLIRAGSVPVQSPHVCGSPRVCLSRSNSLSGVFSSENSSVFRPKASLHFDVNCRGDKGIRRVCSENDVIRSVNEFSGGSFSCFPARIPEEEYVSEGGDDDDNGGISSLLRRSASFSGVRPECGIPLEEHGFSGGGFGEGGKSAGGDGGGDDYGFSSLSGGNSDRSKIGDYYQKMLKKNPSDSLLLRNYGKFLQEVEKDTEGAEEYYSRAILANPGDGELLSLYGKLIWDTERDEDRAKSYFDQAVHASPDDCMVLGSYAHFMWEADEDDDDTEEINKKTEMSPSRALVPAF
ncbi:uncharacterized protein LOC107430603 [Ziziphus jujuba]|uniref:Uncharacterized protein LOC107430603 n=1 Tax=Ziziphus jujuba TaxID=326968 RepID=A0A6P6GM60_ZIZJJ|nr:uncharacterized protein LOC107430603 [Ziziphus jujuba]